MCIRDRSVVGQRARKTLQHCPDAAALERLCVHFGTDRKVPYISLVAGERGAGSAGTCGDAAGTSPADAIAQSAFEELARAAATPERAGAMVAAGEHAAGRSATCWAWTGMLRVGWSEGDDSEYRP